MPVSIIQLQSNDKITQKTRASCGAKDGSATTITWKELSMRRQSDKSISTIDLMVVLYGMCVGGDWVLASLRQRQIVSFHS